MMKDKKIIIIIIGVVLIVVLGFIFLKKSNEPKRVVLYKMNYNGIDCLTPTLYLYDDNTYEYYYTFTTEGKEIIPKTGKYNYDFSKVLKKIDKYEEDPTGPYIIRTQDDKQYTTYITNNELKEFLGTIDVIMEKCLVSQE